MAFTTNTVRAIIFDFGMVISTFDVDRFLRNLTPYTGKSILELRHVLAAVKGIVVEYETGRLSTEEFIDRVFAATDLPLTRDQFRIAYNDIFTPITSTHDLIRRLKPSYRLGLLSNTSEWHFEHAIKTVDVFRLFDAVTLSFEVKALKPAATIYQDMLSKLGVPAKECVYIDDIQENVEAARDLGMHALRYTGYDRLVADLRAAGVTC
jgi:HAD superfamily hydrolase (TIGR01549 family)